MLHRLFIANMHVATVFILLVIFVSMYRGEVTVDIDKSVVCERESVTLTCTVKIPNVNPPTFIHWKRNNEWISSGYNVTVDLNAGKSYVYINSASTLRDGGNWQCTGGSFSGTGSAGQSIQDTGTAHLLISARATATIKDKGRLLFTDGMVTNITCYTGTLDPNVSFTWYLDSTDNVPPEQTSGVIDGATASILQLTSTKHLNNKTLYCSATNQCGTGNTDNITLDIRSILESPSELILDRLSHNSVCIKLKPGFDGGDSQRFIFEYSVDNGTWVTAPIVELTKEGDVLNRCIENLIPDSDYYVRVIASNKFGSSKPVYLALRTSAAPLKSGGNDHKENSTVIALVVCLCFACCKIYWSYHCGDLST
ncbi:contactin-2-like [Patella vulgata]|uniref:contactin-2-like n=1 Tax=Patella vulgata TaxID=6465 RepID=UPI0024A9E755|nr:contactin-2-like [Patella vulgata]